MRRPELMFDDALRTFLEREGQSLLTCVSERNTCARLDYFIERQLEQEGVTGYYADVEYNRKQRGMVKTIINNEFQIVAITADLIVHSRGEKPFPHDNLIAVEAKKASRPTKEKAEDIYRLIAMTRKPLEDVWGWEVAHPEHVCGYSVGIFMEIFQKEQKVSLEYFKKGIKTKERLLPITGSV